MESIDTVVIGAGAAGLATGQALAERAVPFLIVERGEAVATSWRNHYDRLHLHTASVPALPGMPFPPTRPPTRRASR